MRTLLPLLAFASLVVTPIPEPVPTMVPYEAPPFDTAAVASAVLRIEAWPGTEKASLGSGVLIREDGLVVTAYHVVQDCIRHLRTDEKTRGYFGSDGSYDGARGALPCEGYRATFVSCSDGVGCPASDRVYLAAAPPVAVGTPPLFAYLDGFPKPESRVARGDYALLRVDACGRTPLVLSNRTPAMGERIWVAGVAGDVLAPFAESAAETLASNVLLLDLKAKLARILAEGVLSRARGVELARKLVPSLSTTRKFDARVEAVEEDIRRVADGQVEAVASEVILEWAATMQRIADEAQPDQRDLDRLGAVLDVLRESARRPEGERVAKILQTFASHRAEVSTDEQWELHGDLVQDDDGASWCGLRAFSGRVAFSDELIVLDSFIAKGMSGGPLIDANGRVLGVVSGYLSTVAEVFRPANVSAARPRTPLPIMAATADRDPVHQAAFPATTASDCPTARTVAGDSRQARSVRSYLGEGLTALEEDNGRQADFEVAEFPSTGPLAGQIVARVIHSGYCGSGGCETVVLRQRSDGGWESLLGALSEGFEFAPGGGGTCRLILLNARGGTRAFEWSRDGARWLLVGQTPSAHEETRVPERPGPRSVETDSKGRSKERLRLLPRVE